MTTTEPAPVAYSDDRLRAAEQRALLFAEELRRTTRLFGALRTRLSALCDLWEGPEPARVELLRSLLAETDPMDKRNGILPRDITGH